MMVWFMPAMMDGLASGRLCPQAEFGGAVGDGGFAHGFGHAAPAKRACIRPLAELKPFRPARCGAAAGG